MSWALLPIGSTLPQLRNMEGAIIIIPFVDMGKLRPREVQEPA